MAKLIKADMFLLRFVAERAAWPNSVPQYSNNTYSDALQMHSVKESRRNLTSTISGESAINAASLVHFDDRHV